MAESSDSDQNTAPRREVVLDRGEGADLGRSLTEDLVAELQKAEQTIDINLILVQLVEKSDSEDIVTNAERMLELSEKYEIHRVENFKRLADAVIDVKARDPDEIEARQSNRTRRGLKWIIGALAVAMPMASIWSVAIDAGILVTGMYVILGALAVAMSGPLAAGESLSSNDIVRIVQSLKELLPRVQDPEK